jgi:hypothetical protein
MSLLQPKAAPGIGPSASAIRSYGVYDIFGNNNYQNTGDSYTAQQFGLGGIEIMDPQGRTNSGTYAVAVLPPANISNNAEQFAPCYNNVTLHWYSANGTEVGNNTNLAAEVIRVQVWGV